MVKTYVLTTFDEHKVPSFLKVFRQGPGASFGSILEYFLEHSGVPWGALGSRLVPLGHALDLPGEVLGLSFGGFIAPAG